MDDPLSLPPAEATSNRDPGTPLTEAAFHLRVQLVAQSLLSEVASSTGALKKTADPLRVEKALGVAKQVIDALAKARQSMHTERMDAQFESAVISAAKELPEEHQEAFLRSLERHLSSTGKLNS